MGSTPASAALRRSWASPTLTPARTRSTRRFGVPSASYGRPSAARVGAVVPQVDALVELLLAEVDEARALGVGLGVEAEPRREQQHRGDGPRLEHHLVAAGVELDRVGAPGGLGRGHLADPPAVEVAQPLRGDLAVAVGGRPVDGRRPGGCASICAIVERLAYRRPVVEHSTWVSASVEQ